MKIVAPSMYYNVMFDHQSWYVQGHMNTYFLRRWQRTDDKRHHICCVCFSRYTFQMMALLQNIEINDPSHSSSKQYVSGLYAVGFMNGRVD